MANEMNLTRLGQKDNAGPDDALFLKTWGAEVMTAFSEKNRMMDKQLVISIDSGKTKGFPATWKTGAAYHTPGNRVTGAQTVAQNEREIKIDDVLLSDIFIAELDELRDDHDKRGIFTTEQGNALSRAFDQKTQQVAILASREAATVSGGFGGSKVTAAGALTDGTILVDSYFSAAQALDEKDVPEDSRYSLLRPAQFYMALKDERVVNGDYDMGGSLRKGTWGEVAGIMVQKSNNVPRADMSAVSETGENNNYYGNFANTVAGVWQRTAIGTLKRMDLKVQKTADDGDFAVEYQGTLLVAKYNMGHGILRPEAAVEIANA